MDARSKSYADYYDEQAEATAWHGPEVVFGLMYAHVQARESVLDIGIGTGLGSVLFDRAGLRVSGMDNSRDMLEGARSKGFVRDLRQHDMGSMPYPYDGGSFDHAICVGVLQFFTEIDSVLNEVSRVLRRGGMFGFTVADWKSGDSSSFTASGEHTQNERRVVMYRHSEPYVRRSLASAGLSVRADVEFLAFMDAERAASMFMRAYVARREPRT
jgi:predicted TPR repeat methyltransferase